MDEPDRTVADGLEQFALDMAKAVNCRDISITSPVWAHVAYDFVAEPAFSEWPKRTSSLDEFLQHFRAHFERYPRYHVFVADLCTTVDEEHGRAEVFATLDVTGIPDGVMRPSVGTLSFQRIKKHWLCVQLVTVPGHPIAVREQTPPCA